MMDPNTSFVRCTHISGLEVYAFLSNAQVYAAADCWNEDRVTVYEDCTHQGGGLVEHDVLVSDLDIIEED